MNGLTIGEVAVQVEVHVETLRYYERAGSSRQTHCVDKRMLPLKRACF